MHFILPATSSLSYRYMNMQHKIITIRLTITSGDDQSPDASPVSARTMDRDRELLSGREEPTFKILSLDGGGIRGIITAIWLQELQKRLEKPLAGYFDLIAGTSTGSILACAVGSKMPLETIIRLYNEESDVIFPRGLAFWKSKLYRLFSDGLSSPKYDGQGLNTVLRSAFQNTLFSSFDTPVLVPAFDTFSNQPLFFRSDQRKCEDIRVWRICRGSSSAPTYFPAFPIRVGEKKRALVDGGVFANNPAMSALAEARKMTRQQQKGRIKFEVASFGTGKVPRPIPPSVAFHGGSIQWLPHIVALLFDAGSDAVNHQVAQEIGKHNLFRFQAELPETLGALDNAAPDNLQALMASANAYSIMTETQRQFDALARRLDHK